MEERLKKLWADAEDRFLDMDDGRYGLAVWIWIPHPVSPFDFGFDRLDGDWRLVARIPNDPEFVPIAETDFRFQEAASRHIPRLIAAYVASTQDARDREAQTADRLSAWLNPHPSISV